MGSVQFRNAWSVAALACLGFAAACTVVVEEDRRLPSRPGMGGACTREYAPVCGQRGRDRETFSNACMARSEGYRVIYGGRCERDRPNRPGPDRPGPDRPRPDRPTACPMIYAPVCGTRRGDTRTFGNSCSAEAEGYRIIGQGPC